MFFDLTLPLSPDLAADAQGKEPKAFSGHLGTHFDAMDQTFPLHYLERKGLVFDVRAAAHREIDLSDITPDAIEAGMFVAFCTGFADRVGYGGREYFTQHPQLSHRLIRLLVEKRISILGIDGPGVRRGAEHPATDQFCAYHGVFVVENLCHLHTLLPLKGFTVHTYPMPWTGLTGLPCRVVAEGEVSPS